MESVMEQLQIFTRRFGILNAACCDQCCGEQISMAQSHILCEVRRSETPSMFLVAEKLGVDITTFSRQVKSLEAKGLVSRRASPDDRRVTLIALTGEGEEMLGKIDKYISGRLDKIFGYMTPFERESVIRSLALMNEAVARACEDEVRAGSMVA